MNGEDEDAADAQSRLVGSLASLLEDTGLRVQLFETHISRVLIAGNLAYKFKKPVRFDFVDFSVLEARRFYCGEEVRLNRRLAPDLYIDVVAIRGTPDRPAIDSNGGGEAIEYAVRMHAFDQQALWSYRLAMHLITPAEIDALALRIARFHGEAAVAPAQSPWATERALAAIAEANMKQLFAMARTPQDRHALEEISAWEASQRAELAQTFTARKQQGCIRECHGDLHAGNIITVDGQVQAFDCIEFNDSLRWIDVMNDIAFTIMDLHRRGRAELAARLLNLYLEETGDYAGMAVLRYYEVDRAMVRSKVALLRASQAKHTEQTKGGAPERAPWPEEARQHLDFSVRRIRPGTPAMVIMHGFSGSGKSVFARRLLEETGAVQLRSDVERKRMHGLAATDRAGAAPDSAMYADAATREVYDRLLSLARRILASGWPVVVDAAFLQAQCRAPFRKLAEELGLPFFIVDMHAPEAVLRERLSLRRQAGDDASDAGPDILALQLRRHDPLSDEERRHAIVAQDIDERTVSDVAGLVLGTRA